MFRRIGFLVFHRDFSIGDAAPERPCAFFRKKLFASYILA